MLTDQQMEQSLLAPGLPLSFLLELHDRDTNRKQMPGMKDSAVFFRLWDLTDALREPDVIAILSDEQREASRAFHEKMNELPWKVIPSYPHIQELADDDLAPLMEPGRRLYAALTNTTEQDGPANGSQPVRSE